VPELVFLATDRAMAAAQEADDPLIIARSAWYLARVFHHSGQLDQADRLVIDAAELLRPGLDDASGDYRAAWGSLQLARGLTAACDYDFGTAWRFWDTADDIARPPARSARATGIRGTGSARWICSLRRADRCDLGAV
jgi:hypothetical protein